jgi:hypothetical protein
MKIHASFPIADGICFDDTAEMEPRSINALAACGVVFVTRFTMNDDTIYGGVIIAAHLDAAQAAADRRGLGETVVGQLAVAGVA